MKLCLIYYMEKKKIWFSTERFSVTPNQKGKKNQKHSKPNKVQLFNYYHQFISGLMEKIHSEIAQKVLQKPVFMLPFSLVVSRVMYMLRHLQNRILKLETFAAPNWIPVLCLVSSHPPEQPPFHLSHAMGLIFHIKGLAIMKKKEKRTSSRFSDPLKDLSLPNF